MRDDELTVAKVDEMGLRIVKVLGAFAVVLLLVSLFGLLPYIVENLS